MDQVNYRNSISSFSSKRTLGSLDLRLPEIRAKSSHRVTRNSEKIVPLWDEIRRNCFPYYIYNIKTDFNSAKCKWKRSSTAKTRCSNEPPRFFYVKKKNIEIKSWKIPELQSADALPPTRNHHQQPLHGALRPRRCPCPLRRNIALPLSRTTGDLSLPDAATTEARKVGNDTKIGGTWVQPSRCCWPLSAQIKVGPRGTSN